MPGRYRTEDVAPVPRGWKVRTILSGGHRVRLAFPPGRRVKGAGMVVQVLHPAQENPCPVRNPAELVLLGGNPIGAAAAHGAAHIGRVSKVLRLANPYDALSREEKLAFGRLGLGKKQLRTEGDIAKARAQVEEVRRLRNRLPNPGLGGVESAESQDARELAGEFKHAPAEEYFVANEPHVPAGNYARLGEFLGIAVKPDRSPAARVEEILFPESEVLLIADARGRQLYIVGDQRMSEEEIAVFTDARADEVLLGEARAISYRATKWHPQVEDAYRGKNLPYEHPFGEEGGRKPEVFYSRRMRRLLIRGGDYTVEGVGIKN